MMCPAFRLVRNLECGWTTLDHRSKPAISCLRNMWTETIADWYGAQSLCSDQNRERRVDWFNRCLAAPCHYTAAKPNWARAFRTSRGV